MNRAVAQRDLSAIGEALESYAADHAGEYPAELDALLKDGQGRAGSDEAYLLSTKLSPDPWKRPYIYERKNNGRGWRISSLGCDGMPGGCGDDGDLALESK